jgi:aquaporin Z
MQAAGAEFLYTFVLVYVVLNTAASKKLGGKNQFFGLAIGFVIVAGAYGAGAISGGCFNPAVAIALDITSLQHGFGYCLLYSAVEFAGAAAAVRCFWLVRPEEKDDSEPAVESPLSAKLWSEFLGTMVLVLTVGLNVLAESKAAAFSIAASLMCMIYATGDVSGGHYNPAVTIAILCSDRKLISLKDASWYTVVQIAGGVCGAIMYSGLHHFHSFFLGPAPGRTWEEVAIAEIGFTFVLVFVVLCVATVRKPPAPELTGLIIGSCVTVGGFAIGKISGGSLNPAVSTGIAFVNAFRGGIFSHCLIYGALECLGGIAAAFLFRVVYPDEFATDDEAAKLV